MLRRNWSMMGIAYLCEANPDHADEPYLRECVRTGLIRWQQSLRADGRHRAHKLRRSRWRAGASAPIIRLICDTTGFQTSSLLQDVGRHAAWLARQVERSPWAEATAIGVIADSVSLVRDTGLLRHARRRLHKLLKQQEDEGWFPERGGADMGRHALTLDALARLYRQTNWDELLEPLQRAVGFLMRVADAKGNVAPVFGSCDMFFVSPYALELLAPANENALLLATAIRRRLAQRPIESVRLWGDALCAILGGTMAACAVHARTELPEPNAPARTPHVHQPLPRAAMAVFERPTYHAVVSTQRGGAFCIRWSDGTTTVDAGLTVIFPHRIRVTGRFSVKTEVDTCPSSLRCSGSLRRPRELRRRKWGRARRWSRRCARFLFDHRYEQSDGTVDHADPHHHAHSIHDRFLREIEFTDDAVRVVDHLRCHLPCEAVLIHASVRASADSFVDRSVSADLGGAPIYLEGGRRITITRVYRDGELVECHSGPSQEGASV